MAKERLNRLCDYIEKNKTKNYPIKNSLLDKEDEYIKKQYFKMLAVILFQGEEVSVEQKNIFERMIAGAKLDYTVEDLLKEVHEFDINDYIEFASNSKDKILKYRFVFDALLLMMGLSENFEQMKIVTLIMEDFKLVKNEVEYLASAVKSVLEINSHALAKNEEKQPITIPSSVLKEYFGLVSKENIIKSDNITIVFSADEQVDIDIMAFLVKVDTPILKVANMNLNLTDYKLNFESYNNESRFKYSTLIIDSCTIQNLTREMRIEGVCDIKIRNSEFKHNYSRTLYITDHYKMDKNQKISVDLYNNYFYECCYYGSYSVSEYTKVSGVFSCASDKVECFKIRDCLFEKCGCCGITNSYKHHDYIDMCISNTKCVIENSTFKNCNAFLNKEFEEMNDEHTYRLFPTGTQAIGCECSNSAKLF